MKRFVLVVVIAVAIVYSCIADKPLSYSCKIESRS